MRSCWSCCCCRTFVTPSATRSASVSPSSRRRATRWVARSRGPLWSRASCRRGCTCRCARRRRTACAGCSTSSRRSRTSRRRTPPGSAAATCTARSRCTTRRASPAMHAHGHGPAHMSVSVAMALAQVYDPACLTERGMLACALRLLPRRCGDVPFGVSWELEPVESDLACIVSRAPDAAGFHAAVQVSEHSGFVKYVLPPNTLLRLVQAARRGRRRCPRPRTTPGVRWDGGRGGPPGGACGRPGSSVGRAARGVAGAAAAVRHQLPAVGGERARGRDPLRAPRAGARRVAVLPTGARGAHHPRRAPSRRCGAARALRRHASLRGGGGATT